MFDACFAGFGETVVRENPPGSKHGSLRGRGQLSALVGRSHGVVLHDSVLFETGMWVWYEGREKISRYGMATKLPTQAQLQDG